MDYWLPFRRLLGRALYVHNILIVVCDIDQRHDFSP